VLREGEPSTGSARRPPTAAATPSAPVSASPASPAAVPPASPASAQPTPSRTAPASSAAARPKLPAGWRDHRDPTGFRVYVPKGWKQSKRKTMVYFRDGKGHVLGIDQTNQPHPNPVADWTAKARYRKSIGDFPGYKQIKIEPVKYFQKAADWEYTFNGSNRRHVNNRGVVTSKKQAYGIYWETSDATWKADRAKLQLIFDSFRPKT
jgi:eukaryotic-like serine/threonine-protein kinase